jgi:hypothetical protein
MATPSLVGIIGSNPQLSLPDKRRTQTVEGAPAFAAPWGKQSATFSMRLVPLSQLTLGWLHAEVTLFAIDHLRLSGSPRVTGYTEAIYLLSLRLETHNSNDLYVIVSRCTYCKRIFVVIQKASLLNRAR